MVGRLPKGLGNTPPKTPNDPPTAKRPVVQPPTRRRGLVSSHPHGQDACCQATKPSVVRRKGRTTTHSQQSRAGAPEGRKKSTPGNRAFATRVRPRDRCFVQSACTKRNLRSTTGIAPAACLPAAACCYLLLPAACCCLLLLPAAAACCCLLLRAAACLLHAAACFSWASAACAANGDLAHGRTGGGVCLECAAEHLLAINAAWYRRKNKHQSFKK